MKRFNRACTLLTILISSVLISAPCSSAASDKKRPEGKEVPIEIESKTLEVDDGKKTVTFIGDVDAIRGSFRIKADRLTVYYAGQATKGITGSGQAKIEKIVAKGNVKITRDEGGLATAEEAVYYQNEEKVILTGNPVVKQGDDFVEGSRAILFLNENRSIIEGSEKSRVRAVLSPRGEKR